MPYEHRKMAGVPQHIEFLKMKDGDKRRHRSKCIHYSDTAKNFCRYRMTSCSGSSQCSKYKERQPKQKNKEEDFVLPKRKYKAKYFDGIKEINLEDIKVPAGDVDAIGRIVEAVDYYKEHNRFDKHIELKIKVDEKYIIVQNKHLYFAAKKLGLATVPATLQNGNNKSKRKKQLGEGTLVFSRKMNDVGIVVNSTENTMKIRFDSGEEIRYNTEIAIKTNEITVL